MSDCFVNGVDYERYWNGQLAPTVTHVEPARYLGVERRCGSDRRVAIEERRQPRTPGNDRRWRRRDRRRTA